MSSCRDGAEDVDEDAAVCLATAGGVAGAATSFLLFLKLNFLGGSKLFLTYCSFSDRAFIAWTHVSPASFLPLAA